MSFSHPASSWLVIAKLFVSIKNHHNSAEGGAGLIRVPFEILNAPNFLDVRSLKLSKLLSGVDFHGNCCEANLLLEKSTADKIEAWKTIALGFRNPGLKVCLMCQELSVTQVHLRQLVEVGSISDLRLEDWIFKKGSLVRAATLSLPRG